MAISIFKLVNGDDIISDVVVDLDEHGFSKHVIKNPARLMMFPSEEGMKIALVPWCPYTNKEEFEIDFKHVLLIIGEIDVPEELRNEYSEQFGSGVVTPPPGLIL